MKEFLGKIVLVVDDEDEIIEILEEHFEMLDCWVLTAGSGEEALEILLKQRVDFVISDIRMPNGDGLFLLKRIREELKEPPPVLLISSFSDINAREAVEHGAIGLMPKPFQLKEIDEKLLEALRSKI